MADEAVGVWETGPKQSNGLPSAAYMPVGTSGSCNEKKRRVNILTFECHSPVQQHPRTGASDVDWRRRVEGLLGRLADWRCHTSNLFLQRHVSLAGHDEGVRLPTYPEKKSRFVQA